MTQQEGYNGLPNYYFESSDPLTPNLGLSLKGMDPVIALDMVLIDTAIGGGAVVSVNGSPVTDPNFNNTTPAAPAGKSNVVWQVSGSNVSAYVTGGGGTPAAPSTSVQFNNSGVFGGDIAFTWTPSAVSLSGTPYLGVGPVYSFPLGSYPVNRFDVAGSGYRFAGTLSGFADAILNVNDSIATTTNLSGATSAIVASLDWAPLSPPDNNFIVAAITAGVSVPADNTQELATSNTVITPLYLVHTLNGQPNYGSVWGVYLNSGLIPDFTNQTTNINDVRNFTGGFLMGDGSTVCTLSASNVIGIYVQPQGHLGNASGTITDCYGMFIASPSFSATSIMTHRHAIHIAQQNAVTGSQNPDVWGIYEDSATELNALGIVYIGGATGPNIQSGGGSPKNFVTAPQGSLYMRTDGNQTALLYANVDGVDQWYPVGPQAARRGGGTLGPGVGAGSFVLWPRAFPDNNYTVTVTVLTNEAINSGPVTCGGVQYIGSGLGVEVFIMNNDTINHTVTVHAMAMYDAN